MKNFYIRLLLLAVVLVAIICTFALGVTWIFVNICSEFWRSILIILFTASTQVVSLLVINLFIR